jgi:hypothetical protein
LAGGPQHVAYADRGKWGRDHLPEKNLQYFLQFLLLQGKCPPLSIDLVMLSKGQIGKEDTRGGGEHNPVLG